MFGSCATCSEASRPFALHDVHDLCRVSEGVMRPDQRIVRGALTKRRAPAGTGKAKFGCFCRNAEAAPELGFNP
jgi:hypothetical protein